MNTLGEIQKQRRGKGKCQPPAHPNNLARGNHLHKEIIYNDQRAKHLSAILF
jgi:hypothetical protein